MKMEDVAGGRIKIGNTTYEMVEAKYNNTLVWPATLSYIILNATVHYSSGSVLDAGRQGTAYSSNYAYITGTVRVKRGQTTIRETTEYLVPTVSNTSNFDVSYDSTLGYYIIRGFNLGTTQTSATSTSVSATYSTSASYSAGSVTQQANTATETFEDDTVYGTSRTENVLSDYYVYLYSSKYTSSGASACDASGNGENGENILSYGAGHTSTPHTYTPYTVYRRSVYTWTSQSVSYGQWTYYDDGTLDSPGTPTSVSDYPTFSVSGAPFTVNGINVKIPSEGTTEYQNGRSATVTAYNGNATPYSITLYQKQNIVVDTYNRIDSSTLISSTDTNFAVSLYIGRYTTSGGAAPASGGTATMSASGSHTHTDTYRVYYTPIYTWSSGAPSSGTQSYYNDPQSSTVIDTPSISIPSSATWLHYNSTAGTLTVDSEGTDPIDSGYGYGRTATITASNGSATPASQAVYQAINRLENSTILTYDIQCSMSGSGTIPTSGEQYTVYYTSKGVQRDTYTSNDYTDQNVNLTSSVSSLPSGVVQGVPSTVSGTGSFNILVGMNSGGAREIVITVTYDSSHYASVSRWQNVGSGVYTELTPRVIAATGRIWLKCAVVASAQPYNWPLTTTNIKLNVTPTSGSPSVMNVGTVVFDPLGTDVIVSGDSVDVLLPSRYSIVRGQTTQTGTIVPQNTTQNPSMVCTTDNGITVSGISVVSANYTVNGNAPIQI